MSMGCKVSLTMKLKKKNIRRDLCLVNRNRRHIYAKKLLTMHKLFKIKITLYKSTAVFILVNMCLQIMNQHE